MRSWVGCVVLLAALLSVPAAFAAQGSFQGTSTPPIEFTGDVAASAPSGTLHLTGADGEASLLVQGAEGKVTRIVQRSFGIVNHDDPRAEVLWSQDVDRKEYDLAGALLVLDARREEFQALVHDADVRLDAGTARGPAQLAILEHAVPVTEDLRIPLSVRVVSDEAPFRHVIPAGLYATGAEDGRATVDGSFRLFVTGATVDWVVPGSAPETFHAYFHTEEREGSVYNPLTGDWVGGGSHTEYVQEYIVVEASSGYLDLQFRGLPGAVYAERPSFTVTGEARLPATEGTVTIVEDEASTTHTLAGDDLTLAGRFTLEPTGHDPAGRTGVRGTGDFTTVTYGAVAAHYDWASTAVAVGLGALVLAGAAWVLSNAKAVLAPLGGGAIALYARVHGDEVLEHPGRAEVYERVKAFPGVNFVQLSKAVTFGASTLNYHLRVLEKNGYITSVRDGRYLRFFDRTSGSYAGARKMAVSALRNDTTAAIAQHIRTHPGVAQCDLAAAFDVTPSTVTWHINRLAGQGLVTKARDGAHTRYYVGEGWAALPVEEQARQAALGRETAVTATA
jgi:DNA-binding transcriptional ArsR family regulator